MSGVRQRSDLLLAIGSTVLMLTFAELVTRALGFPRAADRYGSEADAGLQDLGGPLERDPDLMWRFRSHVDAVQALPGSGVRWRIRTDAAGLPGEDRPTERGRPLVVCAGDSVTAGYGVGDRWSYPALLEGAMRGRGLAGTRVINAGVYGYSSEQGRRLLEVLLARLHPDVVVLCYGINDAARALWPDPSLMERSSLRLLQRGLSRSRLYRTLRDLVVGVRLQAAVGRLRSPRVEPARYAENLRSMVEIARRQDATPIIVTPPSLWDWGVSAPRAERRPELVVNAVPMTVYQSVAGAVAVQSGVEYVHLPILTGATGASAGRFIDFCHPDEEGHCLLAAELTVRIEDRLRQDSIWASEPEPVVVAVAGGSGAPHSKR